MYGGGGSGSVIIKRGTGVVKGVAPTLPIVILPAVGDAYQFRLGPEFHAEAAALPAKPAHLRTSKRDAQIAQKKTVDPYHPGLDFISDPQRAIDVRGPDVSRESEARRVGAGDRLLFVVETLDCHHRPTDFLAHGPRLRTDAVEQCRQRVESARRVGGGRVSGHHLRR